MKCSNCGKEILYQPPAQFFTLTTHEMVWGEQTIWPMEIGKVVLCSSECLIDLPLPIKEGEGL